jgi:hypothetical protein
VDKLLVQELVCYVFLPHFDNQSLQELKQTMPEIALVLDLKQEAQQTLLFRIHEAIEKINRYEPSDARGAVKATNQPDLVGLEFFEHGERKMLRVRNPKKKTESLVVSTLRNKLVFSTLVPDKTMSFLNSAAAGDVSNENGSKEGRGADNDTPTVFWGELNLKGLVKFLADAVSANLPDTDSAAVNDLNQQIPFLLWEAIRKTFELDKLHTAGATVELGVSDNIYEQNLSEYLTFDQPLTEGSGLYKILNGGAKLKPPFPAHEHMLLMSRVDLLGVYNSFSANLDPALNGFLMIGLMQMRQHLGTDIVGLLALFAGDFYLYMGLPERLEQAESGDNKLDLQQMFADKGDFAIVCGLDQPARLTELIDQFLERMDQNQLQGNVKMQDTDTGKKYFFSAPNNTEQQLLLQVGQERMMFGMQASVEKIQKRKQQPFSPELTQLLAKHPNAATIMFMTPKTARHFAAYQLQMDRYRMQMVAQLVEDSHLQVPTGFKKLADKTSGIVTDLLAHWQEIATAIQKNADSLTAVAELENQTFELVIHQKYNLDP